MAAWQQFLGIGIVAATTSSLCVLVLASAPDESASLPSLTEAASRIEKRLELLEKRTPGVGMLMSNTQTHFAKLWYALQYENWDLAAFELKEVTERLEQAAFVRPQEAGVNLMGLTEAMKQGSLARIASEVIAKKDKSAIESAYGEAIQNCNGCHQQTGRAFIRVMRPTAPPVYSQDFSPPASK
jgi:hypothetical protein